MINGGNQCERNLEICGQEWVGAEAGLEGMTIRQGWFAVKLQPQWLPQVFISEIFLPKWKITFCSCHLNSEVGCHFNSLLGCSIKLYWKAAQWLWAEAHLQAARELLWFYCWFSSYFQISRSLEAISSSCLLFLDKVLFCLQLAKERSWSFINEHASKKASCIKMPFDKVNTVRPAKRFGIPYKFSVWYVSNNQTYLRLFLRFYFFCHHLSLSVIKIVLGFNDVSQSLTCLQHLFIWM